MSKTEQAARRNGRRLRLALGWVALAAVAGTAPAQTVADSQTPETNLDIPANLQIFGKFDPNIRKPTAVVNDSVLTGTDVDQRVAFLVAANGGAALPPEERDRVKLQVLRQLIDETLEIQEAKSHDITLKDADIDKAFARFSSQFQRTPAQMKTWLRQIGSSEASIRREIQGELTWSRYLSSRVTSQTNVSEEEVQDIIKRLQADKGTNEYHLKEIYIRADPDHPQQALALVQQVMAQIKTGKQPFELLARQYSDSPTKSVGGDLDWVRASTLPDPLAQAAQEMQVGQVAGPIELPGSGYSILALVDKRQVLTADPRDARLSLKQLTVSFPAGTTQAQATQRAAVFAKTVQSIHGCGAVNKTAASIGAEVVDNDQITIRQLPPQLQDILLKMQVGEATPPFGSPSEGVRALVLCGRDDPVGGQLPDPERLQDQLVQQRVNLRAAQLLRDLRRDAIIEYR